MAANLSSDSDDSKEINVINEDSSGFANIFASEFNKADIHDRVLCFEVIREGLKRKDDSEGEDGELENEHEVDEKDESNGNAKI